MAAESSSEPAVTSDGDQPQAANGDVPAPGPPAQDLDFVTLGMFIIGMLQHSLTMCVYVWVCGFVGVCICVCLSFSPGLPSSHVFCLCFVFRPD